MLTISSLTLIPWRTFGTGEPSWWPSLIGAVLLLFAGSTIILPFLRPLRGYLAILSACYFLGFGGGWQWGLIPLIKGSQSWTEWAATLPWWISTLATHLLRLTPALTILLFQHTRGKSFSDIFLVKGNTSASVEPSKLLGIKKPESWMRVGSIFAIIFFSCTLLIMILTTQLSVDTIFRSIPLIPTALLVAAINSFNEEFTLRAAPLAELKDVLGKQQSLLLTTVYFGLGHYYGIPSGVFGVLLASFLGWFIGKSILETRGFAWAWLIHFLPDAIIFSFLAMSATG
jgi:hypothetical protein